ncbi:MAG: UDP-N-acetyl-D-glucosamine 2-epimerase [Erysipelotrichaceae bacterium]|nr:MAG: UDP-N-acetyl-D-glucosamine [Erysipelotrichaceae bacterium]TXT18467.1 MAG: UDP-N-acetyl-D-glucosamine 2-epimerase [Erysipelotrichaceae bacterium]
MKNIAVVTSTRADYGLFKPLLSRISSSSEFNLRLLVTGTHLKPSFGYSIQEIINDGFSIAAEVDILKNYQDDAVSIGNIIASTIFEFTKVLSQEKPDMLILLGDRFEILAVAFTAFNLRIPIIHLYGGETTEGAQDDAYRHAITKLSHLHFTSTDDYRKKVIQMGENPQHVFNVGSLGVENIKNLTLMTRTELCLDLNINSNDRFALLTFHPETLEPDKVEAQINEVLKVIALRIDLHFIITKANADANGLKINRLLEAFTATHTNCHLYANLGTLRYLSMMKESIMVIGNSSSGIIETPSLHIPTINIGDRQKGRVQADSIFNCDCDSLAINNMIDLVLDIDLSVFQNTQNPYENGTASEKIIDIIIREFVENEFDFKKSFYVA